MKCSEHRQGPKPYGYTAWIRLASEAYRKGYRQQQCSECGRCAAPGGFECRAVGQAVAGYRRENEVLRSARAEASRVLRSKLQCGYCYEDDKKKCVLCNAVDDYDSEVGT